MTQTTLGSGLWTFHAAPVAMTDLCLALGCGHRLDAHWVDDSFGLSCDRCAAYCEVAA